MQIVICIYIQVLVIPISTAIIYSKLNNYFINLIFNLIQYGLNKNTHLLVIIKQDLKKSRY